jgi:hypothetical protein
MNLLNTSHERYFYAIPVDIDICTDDKTGNGMKNKRGKKNKRIHATYMKEVNRISTIMKFCVN